MENTIPLLIVAGAILSLLGIQRLLVSLGEPQQEGSDQIPVAPARGRPLLNDVSGAGLDERGTESLRNHILEGNQDMVCAFIAFNRPGIDALDQYLADLREQFQQTLGQPLSSAEDEKTASIAKNFEFPTPPKGMRLDELNAEERKLLLCFDPKKQRLITRELMARFGGHAFPIFFKLYRHYAHEETLHIPPFNEDRKEFETLANSGIAAKGRQIPLEQRLLVLKMGELRQMAKDLNLTQKFSRKADAVQILAKVPGAAVLLSMQYVIDDLFMLKPLDVDPKAIEEEWSFITAYAKLLMSLRLSAS
jgi:hypothetical protein